MPLFILPIIVFATVVFIVLALTAPSESVVQARLRAYGYRLGNRDLSTPFSERVLLPAIGWLARIARYFSPRLIEADMRRRLDQAGRPAGLDVSSFLALKAVPILLLPLLIIGIPVLRAQVEVRPLLLAAFVAVLVWKLPDIWLSMRISARQHAIERALPDAIDLIVVCVEAGYALEGALATVTEKLRGPLADELDRTLREITLGKLRREALRDLSQRVGVADLQAFIAAILQADQLGVSIAHVLRVQADAIRVRRRQWAEEHAAKLAVKLLLPLVFLIFPAIFIVVLGPVALRILEFLFTMSRS